MRDTDTGLLITIKDKRWRTVPHIRALVRRAVAAVWDLKKAQVSLVLADDAFVHALNKTYRGKDCPTNVLSFPMPDSVLKGDIVLSYDTVQRETVAQKKTFAAHLCHLIVHGCLHLKGYDHVCDEQAEQMETLEKTIMKEMGFKNPYESI